jgi:ADP-ribosylglycohydrolase
MSNADLLRRAHGALIGAAVGDAMGAPVEGRSAAQIRERYGRVTGFVSDASSGTDDTDFTLFNAYLLATYGKNITLEQVEAEWRDKLLGPGRAYRPGGFSDVISTRNLAAGLHAPRSGAFNHQMWSDGVAMAIGAAGIVAAGKPDVAARLAVTLGSVSNARDGIAAAQAVAAAIAVAMVGASPQEMLRAGVDAAPSDSWTGRVLRRVVKVVRGAGTAPGAEALDATLERLAQEVVVGWWPWADLAPEAVGLAFGAFAAAQGEFRRVVPAAVSLGRDADTIGAMAGAMAGAYGGRDAIPDEWAARATMSPGKCIGFVAGLDIEALAARLLAQTTVAA